MDFASLKNGFHRDKHPFDKLGLYKEITATPQGKQMFDYVYNDEHNYGITADLNSDCLACGGDTYRLLAQLIPRNRVVYDFGAAYGFQSWYFRFHRRYIAIQVPSPLRVEDNPFRTDNSIWYYGTIHQFFKEFFVETNSFAICNYVPDTAAVNLVKQHCPHVFVNYPCREDFQ